MCFAPFGLAPGTQSEVCRARDESLHQPNGKDEEREGGGGNGKKARMPGQSDTESILSQSETQEQDVFCFFFSFQQVKALFA